MRTPSPVFLLALDEELAAAIKRLPAILAHLDAQKAQTSTLSLTAASRRIRRRTADVADAIKSGALKAKRDGRTWRIIAADADRWAQR